MVILDDFRAIFGRSRPVFGPGAPKRQERLERTKERENERTRERENERTRERERTRENEREREKWPLRESDIVTEQ